jgi:hypothetical protein
MPTLADIYSALNTFKRKSSDFVQNPGTSLEQMLFAANENAREFNKKHALATDYTIAQARGQQPTPEQTQAEMGLRNTLAQAYNPAGIFVGPNSATFNKINAVRAQELEKAGKTAEEIWEQTGTFRGPDKQWRQEISDKNLKIQDYRNTGGAIVIKHPELQAAYEQLPRGVKVRPSAQIEDMAGYEAPRREFDWKMGEGGTIHVPSTQVMPKDVYAHELQHAVQAREGFARGGSPTWAAQEKDKMLSRMAFLNSELSDAAKALDKYPKGSPEYKQYREMYDSAMAEKMQMNPMMVQNSPNEIYRNLAGEAEARATQSRLELSDEERRKLFPLRSYDVPIRDLIIRN